MSFDAVLYQSRAWNVDGHRLLEHFGIERFVRDWVDIFARVAS